jgi:hypothetical protein
MRHCNLDTYTIKSFWCLDSDLGIDDGAESELGSDCGVKIWSNIIVFMYSRSDEKRDAPMESV